MRQIILITDGCSNTGIDPVAAAARARAEGITVNVIGLLGASESERGGAAEIEAIARAGGGLSRVVTPDKLSGTVQMMTRRTVVQTIQQAVGRELQHIFGDARIERLAPERRAQVVQVMDELSETAPIRVVLLIDTSASMKPRLQAVKEAIYDLQLSLQSRSGPSETAVFRFPGPSTDQDVKLEQHWTNDLANLNRLFYKLNMKGLTPTGPALISVIQFMSGGDAADIYSREGAKRDLLKSRDSRFDRERAPEGKDGMLSDYIV